MINSFDDWQGVGPRLEVGGEVHLHIDNGVTDISDGSHTMRVTSGGTADIDEEEASDFPWGDVDDLGNLDHEDGVRLVDGHFVATSPEEWRHSYQDPRQPVEAEPEADILEFTARAVTGAAHRHTRRSKTDRPRHPHVA